MKRSLKLSLGVTLLEILLVLAIAAMIIVVSIRYYQNATNAQDANTLLEQLQSITAAADSLALGASSYSGVTSTDVASVAGAKNMNTPYGTTITFSGQTATGYQVSVPGIPDGVCASLKAEMATNSRITSAECTTGKGGTAYSYTYDSTK